MGFNLLHTSSTYYNGDDLFPGACDSEGCRWGDYSGAAQGPVNPKDVWVVSGSADDAGTTSYCTTIHACWDTQIAEVTVSGPTITSISPAYGAIAGGQSVTVDGTDFGEDTTVTFGGSSIATLYLSPGSFKFTTPPSGVAGGTDQLQATDVLGASRKPRRRSSRTSVSRTTPRSLPSASWDTRPGNTCVQCSTNPTFGPNATEKLQLTGVTGLKIGSDPIPAGATAVVLNVTEVAGTAGGLLTVYPYGSVIRPTASNLNFLRARSSPTSSPSR